jgi:hypothetical protein
MINKNQGVFRAALGHLHFHIYLLMRQQERDDPRVRPPGVGGIKANLDAPKVPQFDSGVEGQTSLGNLQGLVSTERR